MARMSQSCISLLRSKSLVDFRVHVHPIDDYFSLIIPLSFYSTFSEIPVLNPLGVVPFASGRVQIILWCRGKLAWTLRTSKVFTRGVLAHPRMSRFGVAFIGICWALPGRHDIHERRTPISLTCLGPWPLSHPILHQHTARLIEWRRRILTIVR